MTRYINIALLCVFIWSAAAADSPADDMAGAPKASHEALEACSKNRNGQAAGVCW
jgi:hypothetical protein